MEVCGSDARRFARLKQAAFSDPGALALRLRRGAFGLRSDQATELAGHLGTVAPDLYGTDRLPRRLRRSRMRIVGSGVVEKHQDLLVKRRMKGRGMRWTRRGSRPPHEGPV